MIVAVLLIAVGALAAAAAAVSRSGTSRGDIALLNPIPDREAKITTPDVRPVAPLFAAGSAARQSARGSADVAGTFGAGAAANARRFNLVPENRRGGSSSFRDFAGERSRRGNSGNGSGGAGVSAGGGFGGGGGWGGVSGTAPGRESGTAAASNRSSRPATSGSRAANGSGGSNGGSSAAPGVVVVTLPAVASPVAVSAIANGPLSDSPGPSPTPEPLTLLLVGSGLAGLYGARKHLAG